MEVPENRNKKTLREMIDEKEPNNRPAQGGSRRRLMDCEHTHNKVVFGTRLETDFSGVKGEIICAHRGI